ncbi:533_t:CDS:2 [Scutellospora calospora]|uniref:533_t:CDS:1 n=1 Tax=Scutellospora calospora TaxID=85575 RepID=A0ACA9LJG8_9GLOM|nr:533_t:CDS:2 [Scutellospora calospora]
MSANLFSNVCQITNKSDDPDTFVLIDANHKVSIHVVGWVISAIFTIEASLIAFYQMKQQWKYYNRPEHQRYIVRLIFLVPMYTIMTWLSYFFLKYSVYFIVIRDTYQAFATHSFFNLLLNSLGETDGDRKEELRKLSDNLHMKHKSETLKVYTFINCPYLTPKYLKNLRFGILQYVFILYFTTGIGLALAFIGKYCEEMFSIYFGQIYIVIIQTISGLVANLSLNMLSKPVTAYVQFIDSVGRQNTDKKLQNQLFWRGICVFMALFVISYQGHAISIFIFLGKITPTTYWTPLDISRGIQAILVSIELFIVALLQVKAFPYRQYRPENRQTSSIFKSMIDSMNPFDLIKECLFYIFCCGMRRRDKNRNSYNTRDSYLSHRS